MADPTPPRDGMGDLADRFRKIDERLSALESPSGTQRARAVEELQTQAGQILDQQVAMSAQLAFLASQTATLTSGALATEGPVSNSGVNWRAFNGAFDLSLAVSSSSTGKLLIEFGGWLVGAGLTALLGYEAVWSGGSIAPTYPSACAMSSSSVTAMKQLMITVPANTAVIVGLRRGVEGNATGAIAWGYQTLSVTKVGQ